MKIKLLFIQDGEYNRKLRQVKFIKELFGLGLKEAKDAVDSGEFIPRCECNASLVEMIRSSSHNIKVETLPSSTEEEKAFQLPQDKSKYVLIAKEEYDALIKYKALYLDIVGTLGTIVKQFSNS